MEVSFANFDFKRTRFPCLMARSALYINGNIERVRIKSKWFKKNNHKTSVHMQSDLQNNRRNDSINSKFI